MSYNWKDIKKNLDPGLLKSNSKKDDRFWKLTIPKDKKKASAIIRILPQSDPNNSPFISAYEYFMALQGNDGKYKYLGNISPHSYNGEDKISDIRNKILYDREIDPQTKDIIKKEIKYSKKVYTNVLVVKDPQEPKNDGKVFIYKMPKTLFENVVKLMEPSEDELGIEEKDYSNLLDPITGYNVVISIEKDSSHPYGFYSIKPIETPSEVTSEKELKKYLEDNCHNINEIIDPSQHPSSDEQFNKFLTFIEGTELGDIVNEYLDSTEKQVISSHKKPVIKPKSDDIPDFKEDTVVETVTDTSQSADDDISDILKNIDNI